jgi:hypothetical protein
MKNPIVKADNLVLATCKVISLSFGIEQKYNLANTFRVSLPRRKGRRKIVPCRIVWQDSGCECCMGYWTLRPTRAVSFKDKIYKLD